MNERRGPVVATTAWATLWVTTLWGALVAALLVAPLWNLPPGVYFDNHEGVGYLLRQVEFQDGLRHGYVSPQWCSHFRAGLGSPYFSFYQPGWFYFAALFSPLGSLVRQAAAAIGTLGLIGFLGMAGLVGRRTGPFGGALAGTVLLTSDYVASELYIRGDISEYAAMMLAPLWLWAVDAIWNDASKRAAALLPWITAAIAITHPCVALGVGIVGSAAIAILFWWDRDWKKLRTTCLALALGGALTTFYWAPLAYEWRHVQTAAAFQGFFHYGQHFVPLLDMFDSQMTTAVAHVKLGRIPCLLLAAAAAISVWQWTAWSPARRKLATISGLTFAISLFLITPWSRPIWDAFSPLHKLQFPWRLLTLTTFGMAAWIGQLEIDRWGRLGQALVAVCCVLLLTSNRNVAERRTMPFVPPESPHALTGRYFAPDVAHEWLPVGAEPFVKGPPTDFVYVGSPGLVWESGAGTTVRRVELGTGRIDCDVSTRAASYLLLRHYYYPFGWRVRIGARPGTLDRDERGLMRIALPADFSGRVSVVFGMTPARRWGLVVSATVGLGLLGAAAAGRQSSPDRRGRRLLK